MHLIECFMDLVAYTAYFRKTAGSKQPAFNQVKTDVLKLLARSEEKARKGLFPADDYDQARFVICAWVDEVVLGTEWHHRTLWQREQLQRLIYSTTEAGEEVFERLNRLGLHQKEVREAYYLCLALGFKGRFLKPGDQYLLDQLTTSNLKLLMGSTIGIPSLEDSELFPEAYPSDQPDAHIRQRKRRLSPLAMAIMAAPILLFGLLFLVYLFTLGNVGESFLTVVLS
jgi:type VI secretion system protein ImpK